jgi:aspartyl-tRNA synthetase
VLLHPYRALTDERGMAKVKVAKGRYTLLVSGFNYIGHERIIDVTGDVSARAELAVEPEEEVDIR